MNPDLTPKAMPSCWCIEGSDEQQSRRSQKSETQEGAGEADKLWERGARTDIPGRNSVSKYTEAGRGRACEN